MGGFFCQVFTLRKIFFISHRNIGKYSPDNFIGIMGIRMEHETVIGMHIMNT